MIIDAVKTGRKAGTVTQEENMKYDYLIVGAGLFGAVFAREMTDQGRNVLSLRREIILQATFIPKRSMGFMFIVMVHTFSTLLTKRSGNM